MSATCPESRTSSAYRLHPSGVVQRGRAGAEAVRQPVREDLGLPEEVRLEIGRRNLHPEVALAHLSPAEVADQRQQRPDLAARELETGAVGVRAPLRGTQLPDFLQVDAPVPP